ncbi:MULTISPECIES: hypothetical protein [unclassified Sphingopyxis]|uniref:hypothetical protein n=1 Tax=unclassified Sphingopyxis TaxID=2614943 RepID=UPI00073C696A|nr:MULTISPECIES: hypothetical protein [unclassified Sphingopyxis]KTE73705.1 hypothetical protein ATE72_21790 [Sphingopyxis sp. HXXIV]
MGAAIAAAWYAKRAAVATERTVEIAQEAAKGAGDALGIAEKNALAVIQSNDIARMAQRPWVKINNVNLDRYELRHSETHGDFISAHVRAEVTNVGKLPAMEVTCIPFLWLFSIGDAEAPHIWTEAPARALEEAKRRVLDRERSIGRVVYPRQAETLPHQTSTAALPLPGTIPVEVDYPFDVDLNATFVILYQIAEDDWRYAYTTTTMRIGKLQDWRAAGGKGLPDTFPSRVTALDRAD